MHPYSAEIAPKARAFAFSLLDPAFRDKIEAAPFEPAGPIATQFPCRSEPQKGGGSDGEELFVGQGKGPDTARVDKAGAAPGLSPCYR